MSLHFLDYAPNEMQKFAVVIVFKFQTTLKTPNRTYCILFGKSDSGKAAIAQTAGQHFVL